MTLPKNFINDLAVVLPSGRKLMLPAIHPKELSPMMSTCGLCSNPWIKRSSLDGALEFPFVVQPCQHMIGSACLRSSLDESNLRCPVCDAVIEVGVSDGELRAEIIFESHDHSPLSDAPESPKWPDQQETFTRASQEAADHAEHGDSQIQMTIPPNRFISIGESATPSSTENSDQEFSSSGQGICHTIIQQPTDLLTEQTNAERGKWTSQELQAALTLFGLRRPVQITVEELDAALAMITLRQGFRTDYTSNDLVQILSMLTDLPKQA